MHCLGERVRLRASCCAVSRWCPKRLEEWQREREERRHTATEFAGKYDFSTVYKMTNSPHNHQHNPPISTILFKQSQVLVLSPPRSHSVHTSSGLQNVRNPTNTNSIHSLIHLTVPRSESDKTKKLTYKSKWGVG